MHPIAKMKYLPTFGVLLLLCAFTQGAPKGRICVNYIAPEFNAPYEMDDENDNSDYENENNDFQALPSPTTPTNFMLLGEAEEVTCPNPLDFCYTLWKIGQNATVTIVRQGCWDISDKQVACRRADCISDGPTPSSKLHRFCCCSTDLCNRNVTSLDPIETAESVILSETEIPELAPLQSVWLSPLFWICLTTTTILSVVAMLVFLRCQTTPKTGPEVAPLAPSGPGYSSNLQNVDNLKVCSMLGQGKYGTVWKGMVNEQPVAVKIFSAQQKQYFINERNIYSLPLMDSPSLLSYFGCDERRTLDDNIEFFLVLSLAPYGCLQDWLRDNTTSYSVFCRMAKSITRGLSHLHTEIKKADLIKPCVCHRDFNSRNILVKADLSCCISDFGFALKAFGSRYEYKGEIAVAETKSINEVGTLRYMAPEVLEGAVNLRDCETALKQIDVYSLGLVLWELCTRCHDLYPHGQLAPEYKAPYEAEVGKNPSFEQMQVLVSRHKARPLFPPCWGGGPAGRIARDTCEDCWDHDAEARLTALCAEERIQELGNLKPRSYVSRGPSPPLNANNFITIQSVQNSASGNGLNSTPMSDASINGIITPPNQIIPIVNNCSSQISPHSSGATPTSSPLTEKNHIMYSQQIQPFQGRNPCQERNLAPLNIHNQVLIEKSRKHSFVDRNDENSFSCLDDDVSVEDLVSSMNSRSINENIVMGQGFPKQNNTDKKLRGWNGVRALIQKKLFRRVPYPIGVTNHGVDPDEKSNLVENKFIVQIDNASVSTTTSPTRDTRVNLVESKKKYQNGMVQTKLESARPSNLDLVPINVRINGLSAISNSNATDIVRNISKGRNDLMETNEPVCIYKTPPGYEDSQDPQQFVVIRDPYNPTISPPARIVISRSANAVKNLNQSMDDKLMKRQRSLEVFREVFGAKCSTERLRDPSQRVKTPGDVPPSVRKVRASKTLSLYDDRMMDSSTLNTL